MFDLPHVNLVTQPIQEVAANGVVTSDGTLHNADVLVLGTGFRASEFLTPLRVIGRSARDLNTAWAQGAEAYKGISVHGFPNLFMLYGPNTNLSHSSILLMLESQIHYVLACLHQLECASVSGNGRQTRKVSANMCRPYSENSGEQFGRPVVVHGI